MGSFIVTDLMLDKSNPPALLLQYSAPAGHARTMFMVAAVTNAPDAVFTRIVLVTGS